MTMPRARRNVERSLRLIDTLARNNVDDAACCIRAVDRSAGALDDFNLLNPVHIDDLIDVDIRLCLRIGIGAKDIAHRVINTPSVNKDNNAVITVDAHNIMVIGNLELTAAKSWCAD